MLLSMWEATPCCSQAAKASKTRSLVPPPEAPPACLNGLAGSGSYAAPHVSQLKGHAFGTLLVCCKEVQTG